MTLATGTRTDCPDCQRRGKPVKAITIESLVKPDALGRLEHHEGWRFCPAPECDTAYFHEVTPARVSKDDVHVRIGQKETSAPRTACYCFDHTVEEIEAEVATTGASTVGDAISEQCRKGLDRCPETNPQGSCCLGNVRWLEKAAAAVTRSEPDSGCCAAHPPTTVEAATEAALPDRAGTLASLGAMASAILSSACCWLPLLLLAFGVSAGSVAGFLDAYRPWLLGATGVLLAAAFYLTYFHKPSCAPNGSCASPPARLAPFNKFMLWVATAVVLTFALFPNYVGLLVGYEPAPPPAEAARVETVTLDVKGMTCEACEVHVRSALREVPGVHSAQVSYAEARALVQVEPGVDQQTLIDAIAKTGYQASIAKEPQ